MWHFFSFRVNTCAYSSVPVSHLCALSSVLAALFFIMIRTLEIAATNFVSPFHFQWKKTQHPAVWTSHRDSRAAAELLNDDYHLVAPSGKLHQIKINTAQDAIEFEYRARQAVIQKALKITPRNHSTCANACGQKDHLAHLSTVPPRVKCILERLQTAIKRRWNTSSPVHPIAYYVYCGSAYNTL